MAKTYPGTTIEVSALKVGDSRILFDGIFASGGISLSQVCAMTGLEPYIVQNWVRRRFVSPPVKKLYSRQHLSRIIIINMLRETLQIDAICNLIGIIAGDPNDPSDDLIGDEELYHIFIDMLARDSIDLTNAQSVKSAATAAVEGFDSQIAGAKTKLINILQVILYAHASSRLRDSSKEMLSRLN